MGTCNSSAATRSRSQRLSEAVGAYHCAIDIDTIVAAVLGVFTTLTATLGGAKTPKYETQGGTPAEDLALQNIQARLRMVMAYLCAQLLPWVRGRRGYLLVLGSANVDEALRGYMTKYDCSSADINPIGGICKVDLKKMMGWAAGTYGLPVLQEIADAPPSAELRPIADGEVGDYTQVDEEDMGMSYAELGVFGTLRKVQRCGPVGMFIRLIKGVWAHLEVAEVAAKVKRFFYFYSVNRHKMTVLTPSYHAEAYSPDDNRFDLRPFLYNTKWTRQFGTIDALVREREGTKP
jgi:NAD+ synthase (glutamine-hydrolysing)